MRFAIGEDGIVDMQDSCTRNLSCVLLNEYMISLALWSAM